MITPILNQPIRFQDTSLPEECGCLGQKFCQLINKDDETQFQISSSNLVSNGNFTTNLNVWYVFVAITGIAAIVNESSIGECDGSATITASGGTGSYTYSIDGITFQGSSLFDNLCDGSYTIIIKDSNGMMGSVSFDISTNLDCSLIGCDESDFFGIQEAEILNCFEYDLLCRYNADIQNTNIFRILAQIAALFPAGKRIAILDGAYAGVYTVDNASQNPGGTFVTLTTSPFDIGDVGVTFELAR